MDEGGEEGVGGGLAGTHFRRQLVEMQQKGRHLRYDPLLFGFRWNWDQKVFHIGQTDVWLCSCDSVAKHDFKASWTVEIVKQVSSIQ